MTANFSSAAKTAARHPKTSDFMKEMIEKYKKTLRDILQSQ